MTRWDDKACEAFGDFDSWFVTDIQEKRLLCATIERALRDYINESPRSHNGREIFDWVTAKQFLFTDRQDEWSLHWMCSNLTENPDEAVAAIREFAERMELLPMSKRRSKGCER